MSPLITHHNMKFFPSEKKGFTLVELLIYIGLFSILLVILTNIFVAIIDSRLESEATTNVEEDGKYIVNRLTYDLRRAQSISTPSSRGTQTNSLQIAIDGTSYNYALQNNNLILTTGSDTLQLNSYGSKISNITFLRVGNLGGKDTIQIQFTIQSVTLQHNRTEQRTIKTTVGLR
jgi:prepilin-type N-terminal cleavage/methylation domain-containing protein